MLKFEQAGNIASTYTSTTPKVSFTYRVAKRGIEIVDDKFPDSIFLYWENIEDLIELFFKLKVDK